jgi:NAD(P)-dependent dehydrogenase (short-subunit alcohol dehydrogenase family)
MSVVENSLTSQMILLKKYVERTINKPYIKTVIFIGSMAHQSVLNGSSPYCAAKAGLNHFVRCTAWELAPKGFRIFIVNPSNVQDAPMSEKTIKDLMRYRNLDREQAESYWSDSCPLGSFLTKNEIAEICYNLTKDEFKYLCGQPINLSGGNR